MTSSGRRSAELPLAQASAGAGLRVKREEKASGVVGGGMVEVRERGRWREKKEARSMSNNPCQLDGH